MRCITEHKACHAVVLLKIVLGVTLVGLHDRESRRLPPKDSIPNH